MARSIVYPSPKLPAIRSRMRKMRVLPSEAPDRWTLKFFANKVSACHRRKLRSTPRSREPLPGSWGLTNGRRVTPLFTPIAPERPAHRRWNSDDWIEYRLVAGGGVSSVSPLLRAGESFARPLEIARTAASKFRRSSASNRGIHASCSFRRIPHPSTAPSPAGKGRNLRPAVPGRKSAEAMAIKNLLLCRGGEHQGDGLADRPLGTRVRRSDRGRLSGGPSRWRTRNPAAAVVRILPAG
jgi:hypothetical protein